MEFLTSLIGFIVFLVYYGLGALKWIIIITVLLAWLPRFGVHIPPYNPIVKFLHRVSDPILALIRPYTRLGSMDISPFIAFILITIIQQIVLGIVEYVPPGQLGTIGRIIALAITLVIAFTVHEFAHAWTAYQLGDSTAKNQGRLTLDPRKHLDPLGSLLVLAYGFGWAKPVPFNPYALRNGSQMGTVMVAIAGPISNLILAIIASIPVKLGLIESYYNIRYFPNPEQLFSIFIWLNVLLFFFNLLPVSPLDGFKIVANLLPYEASRTFKQTEPFGIFILLGLMFIFPAALGIIIGVPTNFVVGLLT